MSYSRNQNHQTWGPRFRRALYYVLHVGKIRKLFPFSEARIPRPFRSIHSSGFGKSLDIVTRVAQYDTGPIMYSNDIHYRDNIYPYGASRHCRCSIAASIPYHHGFDYDRRFHPARTICLCFHRRDVFVSSPKGSSQYSKA